MNFLELLKNLPAVVGPSLKLVPETRRLVEGLRRMAGRHLLPTITYENLLLELVLDIRDARGARAVVMRRQRVRFLVEDASVVRNPVWGEGNQFARYAVRGARCVSLEREGGRRTALLGVPERPAKGSSATVTSRRVIQRGFTEPREYFETAVERPTRRLAMKVLFPCSRPPREARLVMVPPGEPTRRMPIRYAAGGRAFLSWSRQSPDPHRTYSLRWSW